MAAKDLITLARAKQNLQSITDSSQDALLTVLVTAVSDEIEKYCRRDFTAKAYDELYSGNGDRRLLLRQYPIQSVQSVRYRPVTALKIINNSTSAQMQQARVSVTSTGLTLKAVSSGVATVSTLTFAANPILQGLANAVTALGNGWSAQVVGDPNGDYGLWPSSDLYVGPAFGDGSGGQGALTAMRQNAELKMHTYELAGYQWDARGWLLRAIPYTDPELLHPEDLIWPVGINNFRVQYTSGYTTVPEGVQEACAEWVAVAYSQTLRDPALTAQALTGVQSQTWHGSVIEPDKPPPVARRLLAPYRRHVIGTDQG
jgi:hypothetical protein